MGAVRQHEYLVSCSRLDKVVWYENRTEAAQEDHGPEQVILSGFPVSDLVIADVDGDTKPGVVGEHDLFGESTSLRYYLNETHDGTAGDGFFWSIVVDDASANRYRVVAEDFDLDGRPDLLVGTSLDIFWHKNTSSGDTPSFGPQILLVDQPKVSEVQALSTANIDGDDFPDVIVGASYSPFYDGSGTGLPALGGVSWFRNGAELTLPVELASFTAVYDEGRVRLNWRTLSEQNSVGFDVERAVDDGPFETISYVKGAGTTLQQQRYTLTDATLDYEANTVTYRLRQIDTDGATTLSDPVSVAIAMPESVTLRPPFPNPARSSATLQIGAPTPARADVLVYNTLGQEVARPLTGRRVDGRTEVRIPVHSLAPGVYFVRLQVGDHVRTRRLTVVR